MRISISVVLLYAATLWLGIVTAAQRLASAQIPLSLPEFTIQDVATFATVFVLMTFFMLRYGRASRVSINVLMTLAILAGSMFVFGAWLPWPWDLLAAGILTLVVPVRPSLLPRA